MWQGKSSHHTTLSADDKRLFGYWNCTNDVLTFSRIIELIDVINLIDIRLLINKPANLSAHFPISSLRRWFKHSQSGSLALILPHVNVALRASDNMGFWHSEYVSLKTYLLWLNGCSYRIAKVYLCSLLLTVRKNNTILSLAFDID